MCAEPITYHICMKKLLILIGLCAALPAGALNYQALERAVVAVSPTDETVWQIYTPNAALNSRRAIRLGYAHFQRRINTPAATATDTEIALLITTRFQPFFGKLNELETLPVEERATRKEQYQEEFEKLAIQLAQLLFKNQYRYTVPLFLSDEAALQVTIVIIQEAIKKGTFLGLGGPGPKDPGI